MVGDRGGDSKRENRVFYDGKLCPLEMEAERGDNPKQEVC